MMPDYPVYMERAGIGRTGAHGAHGEQIRLDELTAAAVADVEGDGGRDEGEAEETDVVWMLLHGRWIRAGPRFFPPGMAVIVSHSGSADKHVI